MELIDFFKKLVISTTHKFLCPLGKNFYSFIYYLDLDKKKLDI